jgi:LmbE family N-acetylglucosaminyl deacetylase
MKVLAVGAHPDDIELGCGGALAAHVAAGDEVTMLVMTDGRSGPGRVPQRILEQEAAADVLDVQLVWGDVPDGVVGNFEMTALKTVERTLDATGATRLYAHSADDSHQDHRAVALCSFGAARNLREVLTYESPSSRHFQANVYIDVTEFLDVKLKALSCHASQVEGSNRVDTDCVRAQAHYRGGLVRRAAAEGFMVERMLLQL